MYSSEDKGEQLKVAQLYKVILYDSDPKIIKLILEKNVKVNWIIPGQWLYDDVSELKFDCTLLHVAYAKKKIAYFRILLDYGADFTIKNQNGSTVLHHIVEDLQKNKKSSNYSFQLNDPFVEAILSAHVQFANSCNPCDKNGLSHFHVACITNHIEAVGFFLNNDVLIDQIINLDSSMKPGYHSLHFTAEFGIYETAELLISRGANMHLKDNNGMTPLHLLIKRRLEMFNAKCIVKERELIDNINKDKELNERLINIFLENDTSSCDVTDDVGLSNFHIACLLQDSSLVDSLLDQVPNINHAVNPDSPICPGYTGLHFAAHCNVDTVMMLIKKGANLTKKDVEGVTPLDICMRWFKVPEIHSLIAAVPKFKKILFSDGKTKLVDFILAMENHSNLENLLQNGVDARISLPNDSPIWPGYTPLHLAVAFSENFETKREGTELLDVCLKQDANIYAQDKYGSTALHLAFRQSKQTIVDFFIHDFGMFLTKIENMTDDDDLSYLHIGSAIDKKGSFTRKLLPVDRGIEYAVNGTYKGRSLAMVKTGWTPLQVALNSRNHEVASMIFHRCPEYIDIDSEGFTVYHRSLCIEKDKTPCDTRRLFNIVWPKNCVVESIGLTHLHVASWYDNATAVRKLLEIGLDIEAVIKQSIKDENLAKFSGCRPLHMAIMSEAKEAVKELLEWGADIFAKNPDLTSPLSQALTGQNGKILDLFLILLWNDEELQKLMEKQLGLTMLHIACHTVDVKKVRKLVKKGVNVNAKTHNDSNIWPGSTPIHVLLTKAAEIKRKDKRRTKILNVFELLLKNEADLTITDVQQRTPLFLILERDYNWDHEYYFPECLLAKLVFKYYRQFNMNHVVNEGLSYFHLACLTNNLEAVEKFLEQGNVDVNQQINFFSCVYAGYTPLHFALTNREISCDDDSNKGDDDDAYIDIVELLVKHGANIVMENSCGDTPFHRLIGCSEIYERRLYLMEKLLQYTHSCKPDLNIRNIEGQTPIEISLRFGAEIDEIQLVVDHGGHINSCNPINDEGYIALAHTDELLRDNKRAEISQMIMSSPGLSKLDELGRNAIHNAVTTRNFEYDYNTENYDAIVSENYYRTLITDLIKLGCNIDHQEYSGKTALHLALAFRNDNAVFALLALGADFNITDASGKTAFSYIFEPCMDKLHWSQPPYDVQLVRLKERFIATFVLHVEKLKRLRIEVSKENDSLKMKILQNRKRSADSVVQDIFIDQVDATENVKIGGGDLSLRSFLCETGAVNRFPSMTPQARIEVTDFFENINLKEFPELKYILKLQYRKALKRLSLVDPARDSLQALLNFPLPYLCLENIMKYLTNSELRNLIAASVGEEDTKMIVD